MVIEGIIDFDTTVQWDFLLQMIDVAAERIAAPAAASGERYFV